MKAGTRIQSAVCNTEVMVIAAPDGDVDVRCGGTPMIEISADKSGGSPDAAFADGTQIRKRYVNEAGDLELLVTKPGDGSLAVGDTALALKEAKPLPSSD
ncbi:MAG: hypothetical protein ACQGVC_14605 [Myxococcota bacterium]